MTATVLRPVESSAIVAVGYAPLPDSPGKGCIVLRFRSGGTYLYIVPSWRYGLLLAGPSIGRAYHQQLRGKAPAVRIQ